MKMIISPKQQPGTTPCPWIVIKIDAIIINHFQIDTNYKQQPWTTPRPWIVASSAVFHLRRRPSSG